ncbi:4-coumarate- ligase [Ophiostoma piceae UAMH 11346]|uniref:4-coumarate-ligase n=1 Tax=Ophiostoma piceae (strain UAMH 11346) TaxID=1262450 RepID=S3D2T8_OPHP1|nr:4-coumarate- ligase [Ophiostoma piceae UAMH 11346]
MKLMFAVLPTVGGKGRDDYLAKLAAIADYARANEPGVLSYVVCLPRDTADTKTVYMVELYADHAALESHMETDHVKDLIAWMGANAVLEGTPTVLELELLHDVESGIFVRHDALGNTSDPFIVVGEVSFKDSELLQKSLPYWAEVLKTTRDNEPGSIFYALARGTTNPETLYTIEAYTSKDYLWDVHAKSQAVQDNKQASEAWRSGLKLNILKKVNGYLARPKI